MDFFDYQGQWWLPSETESSVGGSLAFDEDGIFLSIIGLLTHDSVFDIMSMRELPDVSIIHGVNSSGMPITLLDCVLSSSKTSSYGFASQGFRVGIALIGGHFDESELNDFDKLKVRYTHLQDWYGISGFSWSLPVRKKGEIGIFKLEYTEPEPISATVENANITVKNSLITRMDRYEPSLSQVSSFIIASTESISVREWNDRFVFPLQNFLTFATLRPNAIIEFTIIMPKDEKRKNRRSNVNVIFDAVYKDKKSKKRSLNSHDMLLGFNNISDFSTVINKWFLIHSLYNAAMRVFFGSQYRPGGYLNTRFMTSIQVLDLYSSIKYKEVESSINRIGSVKKLSILLRDTDNVLRLLIPNQEHFIARVTVLRNYYAHYNFDLKREENISREVYWLNEAMFFIFQIHLLFELGLGKEDCVQLLEDNQRYVNACNFSRDTEYDETEEK